jgi:hypothetical protein
MDSDIMEGLGMAGDMTFRILDRDVTRTGTWDDEEGDIKAWQDEDKDSEAGNQT